MSTTASIKVRREIVELADKMVRYGLARSMTPPTTSILPIDPSRIDLEVEISSVDGLKEFRDVEELEKSGFRIAHGRLSKMLEEERH
jgi:hypothetical protein